MVLSRSQKLGTPGLHTIRIRDMMGQNVAAVSGAKEDPRKLGGVPRAELCFALLKPIGLFC